MSRSLSEQFGLVHDEVDRGWLLVGRVALAGEQAADGGTHLGAYLFLLAPVDSGVGHAALPGSQPEEIYRLRELAFC